MNVSGELRSGGNKSLPFHVARVIVRELSALFRNVVELKDIVDSIRGLD